MRSLITSLCTSGLIWGAIWAGNLQLIEVQPEFPSEVSAELRAVLQEPGVSVALEGRPQADFWFASEVPSGGTGGMALGVNFNQFPVGALLGVVRLNETWYDYKNLPVTAGLYILRYGLQPADGNHTGISIYRDYAMLLPLDEDAGLEAAYSQADLNRLGRGSTGTPHPGVMALFPIWDTVEGVAIVPTEIDQPALVWQADGTQIGFVLQGHGELEGY